MGGFVCRSPDGGGFLIVQHAVALVNGCRQWQFGKWVAPHRAALYRPGEASSPIGGSAAGDGGAAGASPRLSTFILMAAAERIQRMHDSCAVEVLGGTI